MNTSTRVSTILRVLVWSLVLVVLASLYDWNSNAEHARLSPPAHVTAESYTDYVSDHELPENQPKPPELPKTSNSRAPTTNEPAPANEPTLPLSIAPSPVPVTLTAPVRHPVTLHNGDNVSLEVAPHSVTPCTSDEAIGATCVWSASTQGNREGHSFLTLADSPDSIIYITHDQASLISK